MYKTEKKNNTSTTIYPKCHNTKSKECLVSPMLFLSLSLLLRFLDLLPSSTCSSSPPFSSGHSFIRIHMNKQSGSYLLPETTCMWAMVRNDSRVHQAQLKKPEERKKKRRRKMSSFPILRNCSRSSFVRSFAFLLSLLPVSFPIALMSCTKEYSHAPCHTHTSWI